MNIHNVSVLFVRVDPGYNGTLLLGENLTVNGTLVPAGNCEGVDHWAGLTNLHPTIDSTDKKQTFRGSLHSC